MSFRYFLYGLALVTSVHGWLGSASAGDFKSPNFIVRDPVIGGTVVSNASANSPTNTDTLPSSSASKRKETGIVLVAGVALAGLVWVWKRRKKARTHD